MGENDSVIQTPSSLVCILKMGSGVIVKQYQHQMIIR